MTTPSLFGRRFLEQSAMFKEIQVGLIIEPANPWTLRHSPALKSAWFCRSAYSPPLGLFSVSVWTNGPWIENWSGGGAGCREIFGSSLSNTVFFTNIPFSTNRVLGRQSLGGGRWNGTEWSKEWASKVGVYAVPKHVSGHLNEHWPNECAIYPPLPRWKIWTGADHNFFIIWWRDTQTRIVFHRLSEFAPRSVGWWLSMKVPAGRSEISIKPGSELILSEWSTKGIGS